MRKVLEGDLDKGRLGDDKGIFVHEEVAAALRDRKPVVALESTVISHGLPHPHNIETARGMEAAIRAGGAVPATIAVLEGNLWWECRLGSWRFWRSRRMWRR